MVSIFELNGMQMKIIQFDHQELLTSMFIEKFLKISTRTTFAELPWLKIALSLGDEWQDMGSHSVLVPSRCVRQNPT